VNDSQSPTPPREFRVKNSEKIRGLFKAFSATEKSIFYVLVAIALVAAIALAYRVNEYFLVTVPASGGSLTEGIVGVPRTANPVIALTDADNGVVALVYSGLMRRDDTGNLVPDLASGYTESADGLTYDFTLKKNVKFSDGTPVTADDVVFTVNKTQDIALKSPERANWTDVTAKKISASQVEFVLKQPYAPFLSNTTLGILPQHIWSSISDDQFIFSAYNINPVGDGPYKISDVGKDANGVPTSYTLIPSADYVGTHPYISKITFVFYPDEAHAFTALRAGEIDSLAGLDPGDAAILASTTKSFQILTNPVPRLFGVFFNQNQNPIFADRAVRQALSSAVDRQDIVKTVLDGYGVAIDSPVPPGILASSTAIAGPNIALAMNTLEKDGWKKGSDGTYSKIVNKKPQVLAFSITTADSPDLVAAANMVADEWKAIGANVTVNVFQYSDLENTIDTRSYDSLLFGQYIDNGLDLYAFWDSTQRNAPGLNVAQYVSADVDKNLSDARTTQSVSRQLSDLSAFQADFRSDVPAVFLYSPDLIYALPADVKGIDIGSASSLADRFDGVTGWYIDTDRIWSAFTKFNL
jgi:peptide/nickel transport system substrate-binding protein